MNGPHNRFQQFRALLRSPELSFAMEAHSGLSAKIVEDAGFPAIWASGLSISAALGVRDNNEASWTQVVETAEFMADATSIPIMLDGDTGFGSFNNARRLVRKLCDRKIAAVCLEDKIFPKTNSFLGQRLPLAALEEFCGKIRAAKDSQTEADFSVVARTESFIVGLGVEEALHRCEAYAEAGADAVLVHSKQASAGEIVGFMQRWDGRCPVVIVPTTYYATPTSVFEEAGVSLVIWANHNMRASIAAMRETTARIYSERSVGSVEDQIASLRDVFALQDVAELDAATVRYDPGPRRPAAAKTQPTSPIREVVEA